METTSLQLTSDIVGTRCAPLEIEITPRMIMNYAAGIGDSNPWHFADDRPEGIVAPPMMTWALTWQFSGDRVRYWGETGIPAEIAARSVHYTEEFEWTRPLRPGDKLTVEGEIVRMMAHRLSDCLVRSPQWCLWIRKSNYKYSVRATPMASRKFSFK